jgi:hypothetical protein
MLWIVVMWLRLLVKVAMDVRAFLKAGNFVAHPYSKEVQRIYKLPYNLHLFYTTFPYP